MGSRNLLFVKSWIIYTQHMSLFKFVSLLESKKLCDVSTGFLFLASVVTSYSYHGTSSAEAAVDHHSDFKRSFHSFELNHPLLNKWLGLRTGFEITETTLFF